MVSRMKWNKNKDVLALMVGHGTSLDGSWDPGCTYGKYTEADLMLPIVKAAAALLRKSGVKVLTDADKDNNRNMKSSVAWANNNGADLYISVHCDYKLATSGVMYYYGSAEEKKMGAAVAKYVATYMKLKYKGGKGDNQKFEVNSTEPGIILETGSIKMDLKTLKKAKKYGRAIAKGILKYIGVPVYVSNRAKLAKTATALAYPGAPDEARYPGGKPTAAYKKALNDVYPDRSKWGKAPRQGASCDVFGGTVARSSGVDKKFPRGLSDQIKYLPKSDEFSLVKNATKDKLKDGDYIIYQKKNSNKGHICMYVNGKIKHASYEKWYGRTTNNVTKMLSAKGRQWVRVYRAK